MIVSTVGETYFIEPILDLLKCKGIVFDHCLSKEDMRLLNYS